MKRLLLSSFLIFLIFKTFSQVQPLSAVFKGYQGCQGSPAWVVITATGGVQPYLYSLDGKNYQVSNTFQLPYGAPSGTAYVKNSSDTVIVGNYSMNPIDNLPKYYGTVVCGGNYHLQSWPKDQPGGTIYNITQDITFQNVFPTKCGVTGAVEYIHVIPISHTDTAEICSGSNFVFKDNTKYINVIHDTLHTTSYMRPNGCDSIVTTYLKVYYENLIKHDTVCLNASYSFEDGTTLANIIQPANHTSLIRQPDSCLAYVTTFISIRTPNVSITENGHTLIANAIKATYQWGTCNNEKTFNPLPGQNGKEIAISNSDYYAVAIEEKGCRDTSECVSILVTGVDDNLNPMISIYPNPVVDMATIQFSQNLGQVSLEVYNAVGTKVLEKSFVNSAQENLNLADLPQGMYFVKVNGVRGNKVIQIVKI